MKIFYKPFSACLVVLFIFCFAQCKKVTASDNTYGLPSATESGANIFACALSGFGTYTKFIAVNDQNDPNYASSGNGAQLKGDTLLIAGVTQSGSYFQGIQFVITGNLQTGIVYNVDSTGIIASISSDSTCQGISLYPIAAVADSGTIQLTKFDTVNKIVSGTFTCTFSPFTSCDFTVSATQGRFDYKYH